MTMLESLAHLPCPLHDLGSHGTPASSHSDSGLAWNHCVFYGYALFCVKIIKCLLFITKPEQFISVLLSLFGDFVSLSERTEGQK